MGCGASSGKVDHGKGQLVGRDELYPAPHLGPDSKAIDVIVWGAKGLKYGELGGGGVYCIARLGAESASWDDLPRGMGRRSVDITSADPSWKMGFIVDVGALKDPTVHVRVFDKEFIRSDVFLAEGKIKVASLMGAKEPKEVTLRPDGAGTLSISAGEAGLLKAKGVPPSAFFPEMKVMGAVKSCQAKDVEGDFPLRVGKAPLPAVLRGVFWLSDQNDGSALATFGGPSNDGGGCSTGQLLGNRYKVRCGGDRSWAEASMGPVNRHPSLDLIYNFVFDDALNPRKAQIYPEWKIIPRSIGANEFLGDFEMSIIDSDPEFPGSAVWARDSWLLGKELADSRYKLVQVLDEGGRRIEPAFQKFVDYQNARKGEDPGKIFYREVSQGS